MKRGSARHSSASRGLIRSLRAWAPTIPTQEFLRTEYLSRIELEGAAALERDGTRSHLTASSFVFSADLSAILLCFHKKGQFWVQMGGHIEPTDRSVSAAAFREGYEEAGVPLSPISTAPLDVDRHDLGTGFSRCDVHWDVGFAAIADKTIPSVTSDESEDVRWWPVAALPRAVPDGFPDRVKRILAAVNALPSAF